MTPSVGGKLAHYEVLSVLGQGATRNTRFPPWPCNAQCFEADGGKASGWSASRKLSAKSPNWKS